MKGNRGEELLRLTLGINTSTTTTSTTSSWCSKKRKGREDSSSMASDKKFFMLLQFRDQMLNANTNRLGVEGEKNCLDLIHLLLVSATAVDARDDMAAFNALGEVYKFASLKGDPIQRVAVFFADALAARILTPRSLFYQSFMVSPTPEVEFSAFTDLYRASPYYQFAHFTANQAIVEAFEDEEKNNGGRLHVVDFDVSYGFQWPSLIQSLSDKAMSNEPISLRITGFGRSIEELRETKMRLVHFASGYNNLFLKFEGMLRGNSMSSNITIEENATVVVNSVFYLNSLRISKEISDALAVIYSLNPSLVVLVEKEGSQIQQGFSSRFMESLHYSAAMFDSLNECLPADSIERLNIEKNNLGRDIKESIANGDEEDEYLKHEKPESWKERMERIGYEEMKLSSRSVSQAKLLLKIKSQYSTSDHGGNGGFQVHAGDEGKTISLGWKDRILITAAGFTRRHQ